MASTGKELLGERYDDEHLTYEEIRELCLKVVTEKGETAPTDELQGKLFRIVNKDDASGYVVSPTERARAPLRSSATCRHRSRTRLATAERGRMPCLETR